MMQLVIDTGILVRAGADPEKENGYDSTEIEASQEFLDCIHQSKNHKLALDTEFTIDAEYENKLADSSVGMKFLISMLSTGKIVRFERAKGQEWTPIQKALRETCLHAEDRNFVRVAMQTVSKRIIAYEAHFFDTAVKPILKKKAKVKVQSPPL